MSDSNRVRVVVGPETTFGTAVTSGYTMLVTGQSLQPQIGYTSSRLLRSDRNVQDMVRITLGAGGELPTELLWDTPTTTAGAFWRLLRSTLRYDSEAAVDTFSSATATNGAKTLTGTGIETGLSVGDIVRVYAYPPVGGVVNDVGFYRVTVVGTNTITVDSPTNFSGQTVAVERGLRIKNGTDNSGANAHSFTIEVGRLDVGKYETFTGMTPDSFRLQISDGSLMTAGFTFAGKKLATTGNSTSFVGTITSAPSSTVMNCIDNIPTLYVGGASFAVKDLSFTISNNSAARTQVGSLGAQSIRDGSCSVNGQLRAYFSDHTELDKFLADTASSVLFVTRDTAGNAYAWSFPKVRWTGANLNTAGMNEDDFITLDFAATYNSSEAASLVVEAFATYA